MRTALLLALPLLVGCMPLTPAEREAEQMRRADADRALRRQHMQASGGISETEYEVISRRDAVTDPSKGGLPRPPTTRELERKVEEQR
jgi:hypothetical protein